MSALLIGVGVLLVCLAIPATLVGAQAPAPAADPGAGQAVTSQDPAAVPAPEPPASTATPEPSATGPPAPTEPGQAPPPAPVAGSSTAVRAARSASVSILDGSSGSDFRFSPSSITIGTGDTVHWTNNGNEAHDVTGSGLSSGFLNPGQGYSHTFTSPGTFDYICSIHPFNMKGSVTVLASSGGGGGSQSGSGSGSGSAAGGGTSATGPGSESAAGSSPDAAGTSTQLPSTGMPVLPLLAAGVGLVLAGALLRRRARFS